MTKRLLFLFAILPSMLLAQHTIKGTFTPANQFKFAFLYRVTPETSLFVANADVDENGKFELKLDSTKIIIPGTYRIVYAQPQNEYNFDIIVNGKEDIELTFDFEKGLSFNKSQENKLYKSYNRSIALVNRSIRNYYGSQKEDKEGFTKIFNILNKTQTEFENAAEGMIVKEFIKACKPYIPSDYEDVATFSKNVKTNYFKNIDFNNKTLQNSNFLIKNATSFVYNFIESNNPNPSYKENIDTVVNAIGNNPVVKKVILKILWNHFADDENEDVANYITDNYLLIIAKIDKDQELVDTITYFKNASIGNIAPDFEFELKNEKDKTVTKKLSELNTSEKYLVIFWNSSCSHCLDEMPMLRKYSEGYDEAQFKVIAVALDTDIYRWKNMTYDYPDFIHVFGEGKWENEIGNRYNAKATPSYFVLDKDKKIMSKPYDFPEFKNYFESLSIKKKMITKEKTEKEN